VVVVASLVIRGDRLPVLAAGWAVAAGVVVAGAAAVGLWLLRSRSPQVRMDLGPEIVSGLTGPTLYGGVLPAVLWTLWSLIAPAEGLWVGAVVVGFMLIFAVWISGVRVDGLRQVAAVRLGLIQLVDPDV
jgi:hypothetical protein